MKSDRSGDVAGRTAWNHVRAVAALVAAGSLAAALCHRATLPC